MTLAANTISKSINASFETVYQFVSNPDNFPKWLGFLQSISKKSGTIWHAETDLGKIEIEMTPQNNFGIADHLVTLPDGTTVNNSLRVISNQEGSEVIFTFFKMPGKTDKEFNDDANLVRSDLMTLKAIMES